MPSLPGASLWLMTLGGLWFCLWRRRWRLAGLPVVAVALMLGPGKAPDLLMSEDGRVLGLRDQQGVVHVASARIDRFVTDTWARRSGQEGAKKWMASAEEQAIGLGCQTGLCRWRKGPWRVAMVSDERRLAEACGSADIVLSTVDAQGKCRGPRLVIDRRDAWRDGAHALWLDESGVRRETANASARRPAVGAQQLLAPGGAGQGAGRVIPAGLLDQLGIHHLVAVAGHVGHLLLGDVLRRLAVGGAQHLDDDVALDLAHQHAGAVIGLRHGAAEHGEAVPLHDDAVGVLDEAS